VTFKPSDKVKHRSNGKKLVVIGKVGDGKELPAIIKNILSVSGVPEGWNICQYMTSNGIRYDYAPDEALEYQSQPKPRQKTDQP
jgi:hypothetical protein